jgi:hypothetical protein
MKITRKQLKQLIKEEAGKMQGTLAEVDSRLARIRKQRQAVDALSAVASLGADYESQPPPEYWAQDDADDHSADSAEEAGMAQHLADNKVQLKLKAAMDVLGSSFPILDALYRHGLGNMKEPEEQAILARHLAAASDEVMANKHWNKSKN